MRARHRGLRVLLVGILCLGASGVSLAAEEGEPEGVAAVVRGMEAREQVVTSTVHSLKGLWVVERENRLGPPRLPSQKSGESSEGGPRETIVVPGREPPESRSRVYVAISGERYREKTTYLYPKDLPSVSIGYDGHVSWLLDGERRGTTQRRTLATTAAGEFTGLTRVVAAETEVRLSWRTKEGSPRLMGEEEILSHRCYVIDYGPSRPAGSQSAGQRKMKCWIAPGLGYAVVRWTYTWTPESGSEATGRVRRTYSDYREVSEGLWLPLTYEEVGESRGQGEPWEMRTLVRARAEYLKVNVSVPEDQFAPPG